MALKKTWHWVVLILAIVGGIYVYHMATGHQGQSILPAGLGSK